MIKNHTLRLFAAGALYCSATLFTTATSGAATFLMSDVTNWIGPDAGPGISQAALVIQWPGQTAWTWGFRWTSTETRNGRDLLVALAGADPRFTFTGAGFIGDLRWDSNLDGTPEFTFPGYNAETFEYLSYFVNNNMQATNNYNGGASDGTPSGGAHVLPPLGSPYDEDGPGAWVNSNTGVLGRPVVDGSWDGWVYSSGSLVPGFAVNAPAPVPESSSAVLLLVLGGSVAMRRRR